MYSIVVPDERARRNYIEKATPQSEHTKVRRATLQRDLGTRPEASPAEPWQQRFSFIFFNNHSISSSLTVYVLRSLLITITMAERVTLRYEGRIAIITFNRPEVLNALDGDCYYLLGERLREIDKRDDIYITVLTGSGRFFSA